MATNIQISIKKRKYGATFQRFRKKKILFSLLPYLNDTTYLIPQVNHEDPLVPPPRRLPNAQSNCNCSLKN